MTTWCNPLLFLQDGRLAHANIPEIWKDYPAELHPWLLRLTEEFDLTFPLPDDSCNIVPCLLPEKEPEVRLFSSDNSVKIDSTEQPLIRVSV